jgi:biopolymer transport protein ExbD
MAGGLKIDDDDGLNEINVTPLVDVMLVLLVIFLVASVYIVKDAIEVELPKAASGSEVVETTLSIVIDKKGALYLNGEPSDESRIARACQSTARKSPNAQAIIAADDNVRHGAVIRVIDVVRTNGLERFALNVKSPKAAAAQL